METLDSPILLSRSSEKCVAAFIALFVSGILSNLCSFLCVSVMLVSR